MGNEKIFCVGLNKTGSFSLHEALRHLGYRSLHNMFQGKRLKNLFRENIKQGKKLLSGLEDYDAFLDFNSPELYRVLDQQYPGSKFIFTSRDLDPWIKSRTAHALMNRSDPFYRGTFLEIDKKKWENLHRAYSDEILQYFRGRESQFLVLRICDGEGWEKLCPFLNQAIPAIPFPKRNTRKERFFKIVPSRIKALWENFSNSKRG